MKRSGTLRSVEPWERVEGSPAPLGATWVESERAWNFALFSRHASGLTLLLYRDEAAQPVFELHLDPVQNKSGPIWHCFVPASAAPQARFYAWRADGPTDPAQGQRFDPQKVLLDPFAAAVHFPKEFSREAACKPGPNDGRAPLGLLPRPVEAFDWGDATPPRHTHDTIVYELHVKGFTARANSGVSVDKRGTF